MSSMSAVSISKVSLKSKSKGSTRSPVSSVSSKFTSASSNRSPSPDENNDFNTHKRLLKTFERFKIELDELLLSFRAEEHLSSNEYIPEFTSYQDICEKLRLEVLIAIDKLQLSSFKGAGNNENNVEFLHKMNNLKYRLSDIRSQYHNAIKDCDFRIEHETN